jgi:protein-S-isoprenylcysteine O-methyltransferase
MLTANLLGMIYVVSEIALGLKRRAKASDSQTADQGSLRLLWIVIVSSVLLAFSAARALPGAAAGPSTGLEIAGTILFAAGLTLRWYSIVHLGRFFTVNVAIASDHRLIDTGPYRFVRHPSYTGALLAFFGLGLCLNNWVSLALLTVPIFLVFLRRMQVEESALLRALPAQYRAYMARTKRLVPAIY